MWVDTRSTSGAAIRFRADRVLAITTPPSDFMRGEADVYLVGRDEPLLIGECAGTLEAKIEEALDALRAGRSE